MQDQVNEDSVELISLEPPGERSLGEIFNHKVRPVLDVVDRLRSMGVTDEIIRLPNIVVVGDLSSGKTSVLESLSGLELSKGQGTATRVPLFLNLKGSSLTKITISYKSKSTSKVVEKEIAEAEIADTLSSITEELARSGKGIFDSPVTLNVSKLGAPDLTLVDLPGITRVPVPGQPLNIYDKLQALIQPRIQPEDTIILNVLSADADFSTCESIRMSRQVDKLGKRTLAVVTKVDMCPDGLLEKLMSDTVKRGVGYICVCNRTAKEASFEEAAKAERELFATHTELKKLSKSTVGMGALASRLVQLQTQSIAGVLPTVLHHIELSIEKKMGELRQVGSEGISNAMDATVTFFNILFDVKSSLQAILSGRGNTIATSSNHNAMGTSSSNEPWLNYTANLHQEFEKFTSKLTSKLTTNYQSGGRQIDWSQMEQIKDLLSDCHSTDLPNVVSQSIIDKMVSQLIDSIAHSCTVELPSFVHDEAHRVVYSVLGRYVSRFPHLKKLYTTAFQKALDECRNKCSRTIARLLDMEKALVYTTVSDMYTGLVNKLQGDQHSNYGSSAMPSFGRSAMPSCGSVSFGSVNILQGDSYNVTFAGLLSDHFVARINDRDPVRPMGKAEKQVAFSVLAYWIILSRRLADHIPRELRFSFNEALISVPDKVVAEVVGEVGEGSLSMEKVMAEQSEVQNERRLLSGSLDILCKSKEVICQGIDDAGCV